MTSKRWRIGNLLVLLLPVILAAGCTNSDPLNPTTQNFTVQVLVDTTGARFELGLFQVNQISVRPIDPDADAALGNAPIGLLREPFQFLYGVDTELNVDLPLNNGVYRIDSVRMNPITFIDDDAPLSEDTCQDFVAAWFTSTDIVFDDLGGQSLFTIGNDSSNSLIFRVNGAAFEQAYTGAFNCLQGPQCPGGVAWCLDFGLGGFDADQFTAQSASVFSFE